MTIKLEINFCFRNFPAIVMTVIYLNFSWGRQMKGNALKKASQDLIFTKSSQKCAYLVLTGDSWIGNHQLYQMN